MVSKDKAVWKVQRWVCFANQAEELYEAHVAREGGENKIVCNYLHRQSFIAFFFFFLAIENLLFVFNTSSLTKPSSLLCLGLLRAV